MKSRKSCLPWMLFLLAVVGLVAAVYFLPLVISQSFGQPSPSLHSWQRIQYGIGLIINSGDLTQPRDTNGTEQVFVIQPGESVVSISERLEKSGLIRRAGPFRTYLLWTGLDTSIQTGTYRLSPAQSGIAIAQTLKSKTLTEVNFTVLPGWRLEEIAATLPTSGLEFTPDAFMEAVNSPQLPSELLPEGKSAEGFLYPGTYILSRSTTADQLVSILLESFNSHLTPDMLAAYTRQGLNLYQAVTLASIIQRETTVEEDMPLIASVFFNRLLIGMNLETDPTVQYALGFNVVQGTWWTNPLSGGDLQVDSPYNTYFHAGLPPGPISNPGQAALEAVANPAQTSFYFFQARCDGSGRHNFAATFEQHKQNYCP
jgi:UPF0755 protein